MQEDVFLRLNALLRLEITAVNQYFTQSLLLKSWGEIQLQGQIDAVIDLDFPNAMQLIDHLCHEGRVPILCADTESFSKWLPKFGANPAQIALNNLQLESDLVAACGALEVCLQTGKNNVARALLANALEPRKSCIRTLETQLHGDRAAKRKASDWGGEQAAALNRLYATLISEIEQSLTHAFVLWHHESELLADGFWSICYDTMILGNRITDVFTAQSSEPSFEHIAATEMLARPCIGAEAAEIFAHEKSLWKQIITDADKAFEALDDQDAKTLCLDIRNYFLSLETWISANSLDASGFPGAIKSFARMRKMYGCDTYGLMA